MVKVFVFWLILFLPVFTVSVDTQLPYDVDVPDRVFTLPPALHEISGITYADGLIACIQDENGIVFLFDHHNNEITRKISFGPNGDYEDIAYDGSSYYVLRSDGVIYEIREDPAGTFVSEHYTGIPARNSEGLCYDKARNALLIAVKGKPSKGKLSKNRRVVYAYDLQTRSISRDPVLLMDVDEMKRVALNSGMKLPVKYRKKGRRVESVLKLSLAAIAVKPANGDVYLLSSTDHLLIIFDHAMNFKQLVALDPLRFNKAEGLSFDSQGRLLISNEGGHGIPTMLAFEEKS